MEISTKAQRISEDQVQNRILGSIGSQGATNGWNFKGSSREDSHWRKSPATTKTVSLGALIKCYEGQKGGRCYDGDDVAQHFPVENSPSSDTETQTGERLSKRTLQEFLPSGNFLNKEYQVSFSPEATKSDKIKEENLDGAFRSKYLSRRAVKQEISKVKRSNAEKEHNLPADYKLHGYEDISRSPSASSLADKITSRLDHYLGKHSHEKVSANGDGSKSLDDAYKYSVDEVEGSHSDQATKNESKNHVTRGDDPPLIFRSPSNSSAVACAGGNCDTAKDGRHSSRHVGRGERQFSEWNQRKFNSPSPLRMIPASRWVIQLEPNLASRCGFLRSNLENRLSQQGRLMVKVAHGHRQKIYPDTQPPVLSSPNSDTSECPVLKDSSWQKERSETPVRLRVCFYYLSVSMGKCWLGAPPPFSFTNIHMHPTQITCLPASVPVIALCYYVK
ncbi:unnamed protein product [Timema podura]|uniref:Uncharacterized protein n=1 Tax=Timema podura TaxID=61482 RepID=A0ABN7P252_TIMPD|nr:unnamed protein product [Timema podura]